MDDAFSYELVYDAANSDFPGWCFIGLGLIFVIIGAVLVFSPTLRSVLKRDAFEKDIKTFAYILFGFSMLWTLLAGIGLLTSYNTAKFASKNNTCTVVEGRIKSLHPMPHGGGQNEKFEISNTRFEYSDYLITGGFNNTASHGGPIAENIQAKICYFYSESKQENIIVRLEMAK